MACSSRSVCLTDRAGDRKFARAGSVMVGGHPWERRRPRRQGFPNFMRVRPPMPEPLPTGATGYSSQRSVLGRRGRRRSQVGIRGTLPASQVSLQQFPRLTGRRWRVPVRSVRLTDRAGHRRFASAGKDARGPRVHSFQSPCGVSKPSRSPQCPRIFEQLFSALHPGTALFPPIPLPAFGNSENIPGIGQFCGPCRIQAGFHASRLRMRPG